MSLSGMGMNQKIEVLTSLYFVMLHKDFPQFMRFMQLLNGSKRYYQFCYAFHAPYLLKPRQNSQLWNYETTLNVFWAHLHHAAATAQLAMSSELAYISLLGQYNLQVNSEDI